MGITTEIINAKLDKLQNKNGLIAAGFVLFKSTLGIGVLLSPQYFIKTGFILSFFLIFFIVFIVTYGIYLIAKVSNQIEKENNYKFQIKNFDDICLRVGGKKMKYITQISNLGFNIVIYYVNTINGINYWQEIFEEIHIFDKGSDHHIFLCIIWILIYLMLIIFVKEPETLKFTSFITGVILILLIFSFWVFNIFFTYTESTSYDFKYFDFGNFTLFVGNMLYALESVGTIFTVRKGMRNPKRLPNLIITVFIFSFFLILLTGGTFMISYGEDNLKISCFDYYKNNIWIIILKILFYLTLPLVMVLYIISNANIFEDTSYYKKYLGKFSQSWKNRCILRIIFMLVTTFPLLFLKEEGFIMVLGGCLFCPILGFVIPILIDNIYNNKRNSIYKKIFNNGLLTIALILNFYCLIVNSFI